MTQNVWIRLSILMLGLPILGFLIYVIHQVATSSFMELAHKLAV